MNEAIKVNDRLPEPDTDVLFFAHGYWWLGRYRTDFKEWMNEDGNLVYRVTHWHPLPQHPTN